MEVLVISTLVVIFSVFVPLISLRLAKYFCEKYDWENLIIQKLCCLMGWHWKIEQVGVHDSRVLYKCNGCDKLGYIDPDFDEFNLKNNG